MADFLRVTVHDRVGWIEYERPPVNAFHWEMLREVPEALERHLADPAVRVVVIGSALDTHFSVGADLGVLAAMDDGDVRRWVDVCHRSEEHTSELQSRQYLVCRLLLETKQHLTLLSALLDYV